MVEDLPDEAHDETNELYEDVMRVLPEPSTNPKCQAMVNNNTGLPTRGRVKRRCTATPAKSAKRARLPVRPLRSSFPLLGPRSTTSKGLSDFSPEPPPVRARLAAKSKTPLSKR